MTDFLANPNWRAFLEQQGGRIEADRVADFGHPDSERLAAANRDVLADLSHLALIRATGPDAEGFLQGQLSNDIRQVDAGHAQLSAYCNPKGRMFAVFQIHRQAEQYYLQLPAVLAEATLKRLRLFILRAKVTLEPAHAELARIGLAGPNAESLVASLCDGAPGTPYAVRQSPGLTVIRLPGPCPRFELIAGPEAMIAVWKQLAAQAQPVGAGVWSWFDIQAGIPTVLPGTVEEFVPQMANLDLVGGVSFNKGCYPGQEIVARMHYLGNLKQRMVRAHVETDRAPVAGDRLYATEFGDQAAGTVVDAQTVPGSGFDMLAIIQISLTGGNICLLSPHGPRLEVLPLPYSIPAARP